MSGDLEMEQTLPRPDNQGIQLDSVWMNEGQTSVEALANTRDDAHTQ